METLIIGNILLLVFIVIFLQINNSSLKKENTSLRIKLLRLENADWYKANGCISFDEKQIEKKVDNESNN